MGVHAGPRPAFLNSAPDGCILMGVTLAPQSACRSRRTGCRPLEREDLDNVSKIFRVTDGERPQQHRIANAKIVVADSDRYKNYRNDEEAR